MTFSTSTDEKLGGVNFHSEQGGVMCSIEAFKGALLIERYDNQGRPICSFVLHPHEIEWIAKIWSERRSEIELV